MYPKTTHFYQIETVPMPSVYLTEKVNSYSKLQVTNPYIALNEETYISLRNQELRTCTNVSYEFHCEEIFKKL